MLGWILAVLDFEECDREEEGKGKSRWRKGCNGSKDDDEEEGVDWGFAMGWEEVEEGKLVEEEAVGSPPFDEVDCWLCLPLEGWGWGWLLFPFPLGVLVVASPAPPPPCELLWSVLVPFAAALLAAFSAFANSLALFGLLRVEGVGVEEEEEDWSLFDSLVGLPCASRDGGLGEDMLLESAVVVIKDDVIGMESTH